MDWTIALVASGALHVLSILRTHDTDIAKIAGETLFLSTLLTILPVLSYDVADRLRVLKKFLEDAGDCPL